MVVDTANESQVAGLSFAVSTTIWEHPGQHISHLVTLCYTFGNVLMKSEKISQNPSFDNFLKNKKWKVIDTANERSVAGLSFAVSTSIWAHVGQKLFPYVTPAGKTTKTTGNVGGPFADRRWHATQGFCEIFVDFIETFPKV